MSTQEQISAKESRHHELRKLMKGYDYIDNKITDAYYLHGAAAAKAIADHYRPQLLEREGWREEFNIIEAELISLRAQRDAKAAEIEIKED